MSTLTTRFREVQDRAQDALAGMSPRDRMLLVTLVAGTLVLLVVGGTWWMNRTIAGQKSRVADREDTLHAIEVMLADHAEATERARSIEELLRKHESTDLSAFLEQAADRAGIRDRLSKVKEKSTTQEDSLEGKVYSVSLSKLTVEELSNFLYEAESTDYPLRVLSFKSKTRKSGEQKVLDVDLDVASYRLVAPPSPGSEG